MTRALDLTQRQVRAICEGARKAGQKPVFRVGNVVVEFVPDNHDVHTQHRDAIDEERVIDL